MRNTNDALIDIPELAGAYEIFRTEVGSTVHGTSVEGQDDLDQMGICVEMPPFVTGLRTFEQFEYRTAPKFGRVRSGPGDLDLVIYGLRKWMRLALQGNPSILLPLFVPQSKIVVLTEHGMELQVLRSAIVSKLAIPRFRGYMRAQALRLVGDKGSGHGRRGGGRREEYIERYGYDTKFAMHMCRLGFQGLELATTGQITLPMPGSAGEFCRAVRRGEISADDALNKAFELDRALGISMLGTGIPDKPNYAKIEHWMHRTYTAVWNRRAE